MTKSVFPIADELLKLAKRRGKSLTPMQLMKLVYVAHGWALAVLERDLFSDRIEAWKYGPVIPTLYQATKDYGRNHIPSNIIDASEDSGLDEETKSFLEDVFEKYGGMTGIQLSNLTHMADTPWQQVYRPNEMGIEIPDDLIARHYAEKLDEYKRSTAPA